MEFILCRSLSIDDLQFLTPDQNLHDLAQFIAHLRDEYQSPNPKVIVWGSGYGGTTATWAIKKFPHLIEAAWSSSGIFDVQLATLGMPYKLRTLVRHQLFFILIGVYDNLAYSIHRDGGYSCRNRIAEAFQELEALIEANESESIQNQLNLCNPVQTDDMSDVGALFVAYIRYILDFIEQNHYAGVQTMCRAIDVFDIRPLTALSRWVQYVYRNEHEPCNDLSYQSLVASAQNVSWEGSRSLGNLDIQLFSSMFVKFRENLITDRRVAYLQCTQTGLFQITDDVTWLPNRIPLEYHQKRCRDILGEQ